VGHPARKKKVRGSSAHQMRRARRVLPLARAHTYVLAEKKGTYGFSNLMAGIGIRFAAHAEQNISPHR